MGTADVAARRASVPAVRFDQPLPINDHLDEIRALLGRHQVVIVAGETGSGKTTQLPKLCLDAGYGVRGLIGHTQPRRLAARTVAARIAEELGVDLGAEVGYAVRFSDHTGPSTLIKVLTDGLLLSEVRGDRWLDAYEVLIVDEAHERSLNIDFLLGYLKRLLLRRRDLKLIITSATIDVGAFSRHFDEAPVVAVGGRGYPVEVVYLSDAEADANVDTDARVLAAVRRIAQRPSAGATDVLIFQTGEREIFETTKLLRREVGDRFDVLPLYARLPAQQQNRIFRPGGRARIIVATNVAETSLTVPNIGYVVDPGQVRISRYSFRSRLQRLPVEPISRASADQRKGRCGRIAPGVCLRLYTESDWLARPDYTDPEIRRTNLAAVVLQMRALGFGDPARFPFMDPPDPRAISDALRLLEELEALSGKGLTGIGRAMARLPVDPRLGRMLIEADRRGALAELLVIASGLAIQDPRERPLDRQQAADAAQRVFRDERSDFMSYLALWRWYEAERLDVSRSELERRCREHFLAPARMREWRELHRQLRRTARELGMRENREPADYEAIHRSLISGSLSLAAWQQERGEYVAARQLKCRIFPGSALFQRAPKWLIAAEISETQRVYARCVAGVAPAWLESAAQHLVKRSHSDPHWDARRGEVVGYERVTLYGLPLVERRPVSYRSIDPDICREIFLRDGLVAGGLAPAPHFLRHNLARVAEVRDMEARARRRDLLVADQALFDFYAGRIPPDIVDRAALLAWYRAARRADPQCLLLTRDDVLGGNALGDLDRSYPSQLTIDGIAFDLQYTFGPGSPDDGVSIQVPVGLLGHLRREPLDWLVPGFLAQKCEALMRALPKAIRRRLAPMPEKVDAVAGDLLDTACFRRGALPLALGECLWRRYGVDVPAQAWQEAQLPEHLRINYQVRDGRGKRVAQGRDLAALVAALPQQLAADGGAIRRGAAERLGLTAFPEAGVPAELLIDDGAGPVMTYPALRDDGDTVALVLTGSRQAQRDTSRDGYARLVMLLERQTVKYLRGELRKERTLALHHAPLGDVATLHDQLLQAAVHRCFFPDGQFPGDHHSFEQAIAGRRADWLNVFWRLLALTRDALARRFDIARRLGQMQSPAFGPARDDMSAHLERLTGAGFLQRIGAATIEHLPRYLDAIAYRIEHLPGRVDRDAETMQRILSFEARVSALSALADGDLQLARALEELQVGIEELRVALFAQPLGTRGKVSPARLERQLAPLEQRAALGR